MSPQLNCRYEYMINTQINRNHFGARNEKVKAQAWHPLRSVEWLKLVTDTPSTTWPSLNKICQVAEQKQRASKSHVKYCQRCKRICSHESENGKIDLYVLRLSKLDLKSCIFIQTCSGWKVYVFGNKHKIKQVLLKMLTMPRQSPFLSTFYTKWRI